MDHNRIIDLTRGRELGDLINDIVCELERQRRLTNWALSVAIMAGTTAVLAFIWALIGAAR